MCRWRRGIHLAHADQQRFQQQGTAGAGPGRLQPSQLTAEQVRNHLCIGVRGNTTPSACSSSGRVRQFSMIPFCTTATTTVAWRNQNERSGASNQADLQTLDALKSGVT